MNKFIRFKRIGGIPEWGKLTGTVKTPLNVHPTLFENGKFEVNYSKEIKLKLNEYTILPPLDISPPCVWAAGLNYKKHAKEVNMDVPRFPTLFMKSSSSICGPYDDIIKPKVVGDEMDYESELAIIIGKTCKNATIDNAMDYVLGFTIANDVSSRKWQGKKGGGQWVRSKSFDTFLPMGPFLVYPKELKEEGQNLNISSHLKQNNSTNFQEMQNSSTKDMIFSIKELISFISQDTTLLPWTVILTGTPEGVGLGKKPDPVFLQPDDIIKCSIEGIGSIENKVVVNDCNDNQSKL